MKKFILITFLVLFIDQSIKIYIKTNFIIGEVFPFFSCFDICFLENPGMAYGVNIIFGNIGKILLTLIRLFIVIYMYIYIINIFKKGIYINKILLISISLIFSGALGNLIDNLFYGLIFDKGVIFDKLSNKWIDYNGIAEFNPFKGYSFIMGGCVVDMISLKLKIFNIDILKKVNPIFNFADLSIFIGTIFFFISLFLYKKK